MAQGFRSEDFFADVVNAVNDLHIQGFNALEDHIAKQLNLSAQEDLDQLKQAVDAVFVNVQMTVDKSLERWEKYCEENCFFVPQSAEANKEVQVAKSCPTELDAVDTGRQTELDSQLDALRSQILTVRRECSKLSKERQTLEAWLCSKRAKVDAVSCASSLLDDRKLSAIEDICRGAARLRERMKNAEMEAIETNCLDKKSKAALAKRLQDAL